MIIAQNLLANGTNRQLGINTKIKAKSMEKLSSGYKINRAADNASGLSISEKLRRQIRGLDQGAANIQDGISLVQTADGALSEVSDILQRARELSIKSYNETNSEDDIAKIQNEVDNVLFEIERIGETTTFNENHIFRGNTDQFDVAYYSSHIEEGMSDPVYCPVPDWLTSKSDAKMEKHPEYKQSQDRGDSEIMYLDVDKDGDGVKEKIYYGKDMGTLNGYDWAGEEWSDSIEDNPSSRLDFSGLCEVKNARELYSDLQQLIGGQLSYPCGTCTNFMPGIFFGGKVGGMELQLTSSDTRFSELNLSETEFTYGKNAGGSDIVYKGYFSAVEALMRNHASSNKTQAQKEQEVQNLGKAIAKDLRDKTFDLLDKSTRDLKHFDRVVKGDDDTSLIVYDYRDKGMSSENAAEANTVVSGGMVVYETKTEIREVAGVHTLERKNNIHVFAGVDAQDKNKIPITLPTISLKKLGLNGYRVGNQYYEETEWVFEEGLFQNANADYQKQLADYERALRNYDKDMAKYEKDMAEYQKAMAEYNKKLQEIEDKYNEELKEWQDKYTKEETKEVTYNQPVYGDYYEDGEKKHGVIGYKPIKSTVTSRVPIDGAPPRPTRDPMTMPRPTMPSKPTVPSKPQPPVKSDTPSAGAPGWILKARKVHMEDVLDPVDKAIAYVSKYRSILGAQQNRLEHAYRNNLNTSENTLAAESEIRDTDMAKEMIAYTQSNILSQSVEAMLAQANKNSQGVLNLLG